MSKMYAREGERVASRIQGRDPRGYAAASRAIVLATGRRDWSSYLMPVLLRSRQGTYKRWPPAVLVVYLVCFLRTSETIGIRIQYIQGERPEALRPARTDSQHRKRTRLWSKGRVRLWCVSCVGLVSSVDGELAKLPTTSNSQ